MMFDPIPTLVSSITLKVQVNKYIQGKGLTDRYLASKLNKGKLEKEINIPNYPEAWKAPKDVGVKDLIDLIESGKCFRFGTIEAATKNQYDKLKLDNGYKRANYQLCDGINGAVSGFYVDIDGSTQQALTEALTHPLIAPYLYGFNWSSSHDYISKSLRYHLLFTFETPIACCLSVPFVKQFFNILDTEIYKGTAGKKTSEGKLDSQCFEPTRMKYGSKPGSFVTVNSEAIAIPLSLVETLAAQWTEKNPEKSKITNSDFYDLQSDDSTNIPGWLKHWKAIVFALLKSNISVLDIETYSLPGFDHSWVDRGYQGKENSLQYDSLDFRNWDLPGSSNSLCLTLQENGIHLYCPRKRVGSNQTIIDYILDGYLCIVQKVATQDDLDNYEDIRKPAFSDAIDWFLLGVGAKIGDYSHKMKSMENFERNLRFANDPDYKNVEAKEINLDDNTEGFDYHPTIIDQVLAAKLREEVDYEIDTGNKGAGTVESHFSRYFFESGVGNIRMINGSFHVHNCVSYWQKIQDEDLKKFILHHTSLLYKRNPKTGETSYTFGTNKNADEVFNFCRKKAVVTSQEIEKNNGLMNFKNGLYDVTQQAFIPYSRDYFINHQFPLDLIPGEDQPSEGFLKVIEKTYGLEQLESVRAALRYCLDLSIHLRKFILLLGATGTGKGLFVTFLQLLMGDSNKTSEVSFDDFATPEKRHQSLMGRRLLTMSETSADNQYNQKSEGVNQFLQVVENAQVSVRRLYSSDTEQYSCPARIVMTAIKPPKIDVKGGWQRRCFTLKTRSRTNEIDLDLTDLLSEDLGKTISWILSMPLDDVKNTLTCRTKKDLENESEQAIENDSVAAFIDSCLTYCETKTVTKVSLYDAYLLYCNYTHKKPKAHTTFCKSINDFIPSDFTVARKSKKVDGKSVWISEHLRNINFVPELFPDSMMDADNFNQFALSENGLLNISDRVNPYLLPEELDPIETKVIEEDDLDL